MPFSPANDCTGNPINRHFFRRAGCRGRGLPGPGWGWNQPQVSTRIEGLLYIDLIDADKKELIWQGQGRGALPRNLNKKEARINEFVAEVLEQFPPEKQIE